MQKIFLIQLDHVTSNSLKITYVVQLLNMKHNKCEVMLLYDFYIFYEITWWKFADDLVKTVFTFIVNAR